MKKYLSLLLALVLVFSLVACSNNGGSETNPETMVETDTETPEETMVETDAETPEETMVETEDEMMGGDIAKIALGTSVSLSGTDLADGKGNAQTDVTIAALALDADGKIVKAHIDVAQNKFAVNDDGTFAVEPSEAEFKTKHELKEDYNMKGASGIGKEWYEQATAFEEYIVGKTPEEVAAIPTEKKDDHHLNVPTDADLLASVTMDIGAFQKAVADAAQNTKDAPGATQLGLAVASSLGHSTKAAADDKGAAVQFESAIAVTAIDADGKIVASLLDNAQNSVAFDTEGKLAADQATEGTTKKHLKEEYGMKDASPIGKEWYEQAEGLEAWLVGKTASDITGMELDSGKATDEDLLATTTITISAYQKAVSESFNNVK